MVVLRELLHARLHHRRILLHFVSMEVSTAARARYLLDLNIQFTDHILVYLQIISCRNRRSQDALVNRALESTLWRQQNALRPKLFAIRTLLDRVLQALVAEGVLATRHSAWNMLLPIILLKADEAAEILLCQAGVLLLVRSFLARAVLLLV